MNVTYKQSFITDCCELDHTFVTVWLLCKIFQNDKVQKRLISGWWLCHGTRYRQSFQVWWFVVSIAIQWFQSLFRCRVELLNFSIKFNIYTPYMEMLHRNRSLHHWISGHYWVQYFLPTHGVVGDKTAWTVLLLWLLGESIHFILLLFTTLLVYSRGIWHRILQQ